MTTEKYAQLLENIKTITADIQTEFSQLSASELNWKSSPDKWSIAQCLDHLMTTNNLYLSTFKKVIAGQHKASLWQRLNPLTHWTGKKMIQSLGPVVTYKMKSPSSFKPSLSEIDVSIVQQFLDHQQEVLSTLKKLENLPLNEIVIPSPVTDLVTLKLEHAVEILTVHEQRHFQQALSVKSAMNLA